MVRFRGRRPSREVRKYIAIVVVKEGVKGSLRFAEELSYEIFGEGVDHSVIHYQEVRLREAPHDGQLLRLE